MAITLTARANERSTYIVDVSFWDENDVAVVPNAGLSWTLTDENGTVINGRDATAISPATTVSIVLSGLDLAIGDGLYGTQRHLLVEGTYNSSLGNNLPIKEEIVFRINDFVHLTGIA